MKTFLDSANPQRTWTVSLNVGTIKRVKALLPEVDLVEINAGDPPLILKLASDPCLLCDVLYVLCKLEADALGITDEQFGESMGGEALLSGQGALFEELKDFFQKLGRAEKTTAVRQAEKMIGAVVKAANMRMEGTDVEAITDQVVGKLYTDALASLDSHRTASHSAN